MVQISEYACAEKEKCMLIRKEMEFRDFDNFSVDLFLQKGSTNTSCCVGPRRKLIKYRRHEKKKKKRKQKSTRTSNAVRPPY